MAARTQYYVDYGAGSDSTGDGSIGTPWKTIQKALDTITRDATNGDTINIKAGTAQVLAAALSNATYGTLYAPWLAGYTAVAGDGGIGVIDGNGQANIWSSGPISFVAHSIEFHNVTGYAFDFTTTSGGALTLWRCYGHDIGNALMRSRAPVTAIGCSFVTVGGNLLAGTASSSYVFEQCYFNGAGVIGTNTAFAMQFRDCLFVNTAIYTWGVGDLQVNGCTFYNPASHAIALRNSGAGFYSIRNNLFVGTTSFAIQGLASTTGNGYVYGHNKFYGYAAAWSYKANTTFHYVTQDDEMLASNPLVDSAGGNYAPAAGVQDLAWPTAWLGLATTARGADIGAVQAAAGGGSVIVIED